MDRKKRKSLSLSLSALLAAYTMGAGADLYFNARIAGPVTNIYAVNKRGDIEKLTDNNTWRDLEPAVSPRGDLVFSSNREPEVKMDLQRKSENFNIYFSDRQTKTLTQLTKRPDREISPTFNPQGDRIAYLRITTEGTHNLHIIRRDGTGDQQLLNAERITGYDWSPHGREIVCATIDRNKANLKVVELASGKVRELISADAGIQNQAPTQLESPSWSPDGRAIAYIVHPLAAGRSRALWVLDLRQKNTTRLSAQEVQTQAPLVWSADSRQLLYSALVNYSYHYDDTQHRKIYTGGMHLFLSRLSGDTRQITRGDHLFTRPVFSPDGDRIAYLYAEKLGDARTLSLRTATVGGEDIRELFTEVARHSPLIWRRPPARK